MLKSVAVDGERIAGDVPMLRERDADPVACVDDGIVFQTKNGFETVSGAGKVTRSVPYPPEAEEGPERPVDRSPARFRRSTAQHLEPKAPLMGRW